MTSSELIALARKIAAARQASAARFRELDTLSPGREAPTWIIDTELVGSDRPQGQIELAEDEASDVRAARLAEMFEPLPVEWITRVPSPEEARTLVESARGDRDVVDLLGHAWALPDDAPETDADTDEEAVLAGHAGDDANGDDDLDSGVSGDGSDDAAGDLSSRSAEHSSADLTTDDDDMADAESSAPVVPVVSGIDEATHEAAVAAARQAGFDAGVESARAEMLASIEAHQADLAALIESIREQAADTAKLFEPLKRLSLHLAQELVRGELSLSGDAISRLVEASLMEVDRRSGRDVVLSLNPADLERWRTHAGTVLEGIETRADAALTRGSVRLGVGETVIEDLIENRLQTLSRQLLGDPQAWRGGAAAPRPSFPLARADIASSSADPDVVDVT